MSTINVDLPLALAFRAFCRYFYRYRVHNCYAYLSGSNIGGFKSHYSNEYKLLSEATKISDLKLAIFTDFLVSFLKTIKYDCNESNSYFSVISVDFIRDMVDFDPAIGGKKFSTNDKEILNLFLEKSISKYDTNPIIDETIQTSTQVTNMGNRTLRTPRTGLNNEPSENGTQNEELQFIPATNELERQLDELANEANEDIPLTNLIKTFGALLKTSSFKSICEDFSKNMKQDLDKNLQNTVCKELRLHFGSNNRDLTSDQIEQYQLKVSQTYNKIKRKEHNIKIYKTHIEKKTAPFELRHLNFPAPPLPHDAIFVNKWNELISKWTEEALNFTITRLTDMNRLLKNDLDVIKDILKNHMGDVDGYFAFCDRNEEKMLEKDFLAADEKCRNIITVKYRVKENFKSNNNIKAKNNIKIINNDLNDEGITTQNNLTKANQKKLKSNNKKFNRFSRKSFLAKKLNSSKKEKSGNFNSNSNKATTTSTTQSFLSKKKPRKTNG